MSEPTWQAEQVARCKGKWAGASADGLMSGHALAVSALGKRAAGRDSGLRAFAYCWRRFGPPWHGSDPHKDLCSYCLTTPNPGVMLRVYPSGSPIAYGVGYMARRHFTTDHEEPLLCWHEKHEKWWLAQDPERQAMEPEARAEAYFEDMVDRDVHASAVAAIGQCPRLPLPRSWRRLRGPIHEVNAALFAALRDLLRPVWVRDVPINILGRVSDGQARELPGIEPSPYAGYGVSRRALNNLRKKERTDHGDAEVHDQ